MSKFYGSLAYITCGNSCESKLQKLLYDEDGKPNDTDWEGLQQVYNAHNSICSIQNPYTTDNNAYYGDPNQCTGFVIEGDSNSGYKYCEY